MALVDLIATGKEAEDLLQKLADQQNQLQTAALQHGNDQQAIADLQFVVSNKQATIDAQVGSIANLKSQLTLMESTVTYPDLEYGIWMMNLKPDAASGRGAAVFTPADNPKIPALMSITPDAPLAGQTDNWFNVYWTQKKKPDAAVKNFVLTGQWDFPADTDMKQAHCIEHEGRQVLPLDNPTVNTLPLMGVPAYQLNFSGNMLRYFNAMAAGDNWIPTGIPMPRQRTVAVVMEAHRDDTTLFYDAFTINGTRHAVSFQAPLYRKTYVNERLSVSLQLDSHYLGGPFKVIPSGVSLEVR